MLCIYDKLRLPRICLRSPEKTKKTSQKGLLERAIKKHTHPEQNEVTRSWRLSILLVEWDAFFGRSSSIRKHAWKGCRPHWLVRAIGFWLPVSFFFGSKKNKRPDHWLFSTPQKTWFHPKKNVCFPPKTPLTSSFCGPPTTQNTAPRPGFPTQNSRPAPAERRDRGRRTVDCGPGRWSSCPS